MRRSSLEKLAWRAGLLAWLFILAEPASAAKALNISYRALLYKIRDAGLPSNRTPKRPEPEEANQTVAAD